MIERKPQWCRMRELNSQPTDYKSVALPIELIRQKMAEGEGLEPPKQLRPADFKSVSSSSQLPSI